MNKSFLLALVLISALLGGCAHNINLNPDTSALTQSSNMLDHVVGYHISDADRAKKVTTPGGGGDKVSYVPYKDIETALFTVLSNKFKDVYLVKDLDDQSFIDENEIRLLFVPTITTNSSSSSMFTWPPTQFTVNLEVKAVNADGETVWETAIKTEGEAEFDEFKADFSLSARRATQAAFIKLAGELENADFNL